MPGLLDELSRHGIMTLIGAVCGGILAWFAARWKRRKERLSILRGDARDTVVIQLHIVTPTEVPNSNGGGAKTIPGTLRIRPLGQSELSRVVPNGHLAAELSRRAFRVTPHDTLISMAGAEGSFLLETLTNFVADRVGNAPFEHDLYAMAPCCEPAGMAVHQPITILLIPVASLALFENWADCRNIQVEHGMAGMRILTLMELARRFRQEQERLAVMRRDGKRTLYEETIYMLDLALDERAAAVPLKGVPWGRFEDVLQQLNLE
ncbi:MAG TPA: hypothetical protein VGP63_10430 [Planctomycetaceae bacterium]|jgi:hypothetical protein|nr:hypothetical protein [Planctomycetaceae bacterium]